MIEFGSTLRTAREAKGYTIQQIAEMTRLKSSTVDGLENEDFSGIAAPIYGRGFVKLYCEAVGIDPKPLIEEFMAIISGNREVTIRERPVVAEPTVEAPPPASAVPAVPPPAPAAPEPDLFSQPADPVAPTPPPPSPVEFPTAEPEQSFSRFAAPIRENTIPSGFSCVNPRILILAGCAFVLLVILVFGIRTLYRATTADTTEPKPSAAAAEAPAENAPAAKPAARTQQQTIPSLYID